MHQKSLLHWEAICGGTLEDLFIDGALQLLDAVWTMLPEDEWQSLDDLQELAGLDENILGLAIGFLIRWDLAETRQLPELQVRRKQGINSPADTANLLQSILSQPETSIRRRPWLAERIACRACGYKDFNFIGENEVQCKGCSEKQWFTIELSEKNAAS